MGRIWRVLAAILAGALLAIVPCTGAGAATPTLTGGGSSIAGLLFNQWRYDLAKPPFSQPIVYSSAGSGFGRDKYISGAINFGQSDFPFLSSELERLAASGRQDLVYVPTVAAPVAFMFNVLGPDGARITDLRLSAEVACRIFTTPGIRWNDPLIAGANPGVLLPDRPIVPVVRSDRSGLSYVFSEFCIQTSPQVWEAFRSILAGGSFGQDDALTAGQPTSLWPSGFGNVVQAFASDGAASAVANFPDTVTFIETGYASVKQLPVARLQNAAGAFTAPTPSAGSVAMESWSLSSDGTVRVASDPAATDAYQLVTYSYTIAQTTGLDPVTGTSLKTFLRYAVGAGQERAPALMFSAIPTNLTSRVESLISQIPGEDLNVGPPPVVPEAPTVLLLPLVGVLVVFLGVSIRRWRVAPAQP